MVAPTFMPHVGASRRPPPRPIISAAEIACILTADVSMNGDRMHRTRWIRTILVVVAIVANGLTASAQVESPEVTFDATNGSVRLGLSVDDVRGLPIPHLRRDSLAVFEDGVRQEHVSIAVEHSPITLAVLVELGGRSTQLNRMLTSDAMYAARPVLDVLRPGDKFGLFTYGDSLRTIVDFGVPHG